MISENNNTRSGKQAYQQPKFHIYGSISDITNAAGTNGPTDNGTSPRANKTSTGE